MLLKKYPEFKANFNSIISQQSIRGSKVYVSPCQKNPSEVERDIFISLKEKAGYGEYVVAFRPKKGLVFGPGQNFCELIHLGNLRFGRHIRVLYAGLNKF